MRKLENLKPERVFYYFEELSKIPRESGNEQEISDYLVGFGKKLGLETFQDENNNVILRRKASEGCENKPGIIIQGHMDMVCEKENDSLHDFTKDPIELIVDGNILRANKTTLGGDNGIALAMGMAILEDESIKCGELELLATTSEETDLGGALALRPGLLKGKMLINIDSEDEGVITVGSAGGVEIDVNIPTTKTKENAKYVYTIDLSKLQGGHSGTEINKERGNANKFMVELIENIVANHKIKLVSISGGSKDNAIPRIAEAVIATDEDIKADLIKMSAEIKEKYSSFEPKMVFNIKVEENKEVEVMSDENLKSYIKTVKEIPTGVGTWMKEYPEIVESSDNLAILKTTKDGIQIIISLRSSDPDILLELRDKIAKILKENSAKYEFSNGYPEWKYKADSILRDKATELYKKMYNKDMIVEVIHAGLECGAISQNYPELDFISVGPNLRDVHTPEEYLEIDSTERVYHYVVELIKSL